MGGVRRYGLECGGWMVVGVGSLGEVRRLWGGWVEWGGWMECGGR